MIKGSFRCQKCQNALPIAGDKGIIICNCGSIYTHDDGKISIYPKTTHDLVREDIERSKTEEVKKHFPVAA